MALKRTAFKRPELPPRTRSKPVPMREPVKATMLRRDDGKARMSVPVPKEAPVRSEAYRRLVAAMACMHCERAGPSQCAHGDAGKGMSIKASDLTCFPLCADSPGRRGCHSLIGASGTFSRQARRHLEQTYAADTRAAITAAGAWPANLPVWQEET